MKSNNIVFILSLFLTTNILAQNLVPNPDFETRNSDYCGIAMAGTISTVLAEWYSPSGGSPDVYFTDIDPSCFNFQPNSTYPGPIGLKGSQLPRSGSSMSGLFTYTVSGLNQREYLQVQLTSPLVPAGKYVVEYYVSLGDSTEFASNNLGFNLSVNAPSAGGDNVMNVTPQFVQSSAIGETQDWIRVFDTLIVSEAYEYLTIGNFSDDASTSTVSNPTASFSPGTYGAYYFVDDVRVTRVFTNSSSIDENVLLDIAVFPNPATDEISIEFEEIERNVKIELMDVKGRLVFSDQSDFQNRTIDLTNLDVGVYMIRIETEKGAYSERIVKN